MSGFAVINTATFLVNALLHSQKFLLKTIAHLQHRQVHRNQDKAYDQAQKDDDQWLHHAA